MSNRSNPLFLQVFRELFTQQFPAWINAIRDISETTLEVEIRAPNLQKVNPQWIQVDAAREIIVAFGASHAHFDQHWLAADADDSVEQAVNFIDQIVREDVVSVYLMCGGVLADRSAMAEQAWFKNATRITSWRGTYDQQLR